MDQEPDRLRDDIEATRATLTRNVDLLAEKTNPARVAKRRWTLVKEKVMGSSEDARHAVGNTATSAVDTVQEKASRLGEAAGEKAQAAGEKAQEMAEQRMGPLTGGMKGIPGLF